MFTIPLFGRSSALAVFLVAMVSLVQGQTPPPEGPEAVKAIMAGAGTHFDPLMAQVFLRCSDEFREITGRIPEENMPPDPLQESRSDT